MPMTMMASNISFVIVWRRNKEGEVNQRRFLTVVSRLHASKASSKLREEVNCYK